MTENEPNSVKPEEGTSRESEPEPESGAAGGAQPAGEPEGRPGAEQAESNGGAAEPGAAAGETPGAGEAAAEAAPAEDPLEAARRELADLNDRFLRLQAEFENYKRRIHKEQGEMLKYAQLPLLRDLTGVMDNLERAIDHARDSEKPDHDAFVAGLEMVTRQINEVFQRYGMERIEAKGQPFDPTRHEAMNLVETDSVPENTVVEEFQTGYALHDRIVRPAMVSVSKAPAAGGTAGQPAAAANEDE